MVRILALVALMISFFTTIEAQTFGRNKPRYRSFDFKVEETPNFKIYHYLNNEQKVDWIARVSEQWYSNHKEIFDKDILKKNPIIFYNNHAEFQQTNTIGGEIGIGTGGVTEALKNRVVMPLSFSMQSNHHVLVHELVHAFQFNNIISSDSMSLQNLRNTPLWMIEGMAEYFSIGSKDPFTAMWMRDAIIHDNLPEIMKMNNSKYFPYRYGHSLMAFLGGQFGDNRLRTMFESTAKYGLELGFLDAFGYDTKMISKAWHNALKVQYAPILDGRTEKPQGKKVISDENGGRMNLSPSVSPDGKYIIFLSEKDLFSTDLYLAEVNKGKIIKKVASLTRSNDLDYINVMESSGAWSPNGKDYTFVGVKKGKNVLVIKDADTGKDIETIEVKNLDAFVNPTYHPNGREIVVTGLKNGQPDLYSINLRTKVATQLTDDIYSEIMPCFSLDGNKIIFSYDKNSIDNGRFSGVYTFDIAELDVNTKYIKIYDFFKGANNLNPVYDHEGNFYFVSDRDGLRNLYRYVISQGKVFQMTDLLTGISGISGLSPMIAASTKRDKVIYTHYFNSGYTLYAATTNQLLNQYVENTNLISQELGTLPIFGKSPKNIVNKNFSNADNDLSNINYVRSNTPYRPKFTIDYIGGGTGVGMGAVNNSFQNSIGLQGGVDMVFSDILGNHQLYNQVAINGEILDMGGITTYVNRKHRLAWGLGFSHVPLRTGYRNFSNVDFVDPNGQRIPGLIQETNVIRIFDQSLSFFAHYPFSTTLRLEGGFSASNRSFRQDAYYNYYVNNGGFIQEVFPDRNNFPARVRVPTGESLQINQFYTILNGVGANGNVGLVGDNSYFGMTSPLVGHRFRISAEHFVGNDQYTAFLIDGRKYFRFKPFTLALRSTNYIRYEKKTNTIFPLFLGNMGFVRGLGSIFSNNLSETEASGITFSQLLGSKMSIASAELRLPFTGPKRLAIIPTNLLFSDLNIFFDAGVVFDEFSHFREGKFYEIVQRDDNGNIKYENGNIVVLTQNAKPQIISTAGVSLRLNLFGALIVEPYYARVISKGAPIRFGINLIPGW